MGKMGGSASPSNRLITNTSEHDYYNNNDNTTFNGGSTYSVGNLVQAKSLQCPPTSHTTTNLMPLEPIPEGSPTMSSRLNGRLGLATLD